MLTKKRRLFSKNAISIISISEICRLVPPPMEWAQRADVLFVTVSAECKDVNYK